MSDLGTKQAGDGGGSAALQLVEKLPPEALMKVVEIIGDVVRTRTVLAEKHADFIQEMQRVQVTTVDRERVLSTLAHLLLNAELNDEAKLRLVDGICELALQ